MKSVLDASSVLAFLGREPGFQIVREALFEGCAVSAVNWAEVLSKLVERGEDISLTIERFEKDGVLGGDMIVHPLDEPQARRVATLRPITREAGLSLADRACLALSFALDLPAYTADGAWREVEAGVEIHLIR